MATCISFVKSKRPRILTWQNSRPVMEREIAKRSYQDCCVGSPWDGRWPLISSLSWKAESGRRKFTRTCGTKPSITWRDSPLFKTLNTWRIKSVQLSMVNLNYLILKHPTCLYIWPNPSMSFLVGSGRRYQIYAIHTSKACNILSKYTAFVPIDLDSNEYLPTCIEYSHPGRSFF